MVDYIGQRLGIYQLTRLLGEGSFAQVYLGEHIYLSTQAAIKADTVTPEQMFGEWALLKELNKPLCKLTLSNAAAGGESYKITVKPGCDASVLDLGLATWRIDSNELLLVGRGSTWRFSESDSTTWERIPPSSDPMVLMRQQ